MRFLTIVCVLLLSACAGADLPHIAFPTFGLGVDASGNGHAVTAKSAPQGMVRTFPPVDLPARSPEVPAGLPNRDVVLSFEDAPVPVVVREVFHVQLGLSVTVDPAIDQRLTIHSAGPVSAVRAVRMVDAAFRAIGLSVEVQHGHVTVAKVRGSLSPIGYGAPGSGVRAVAVAHIVPSALVQTLTPLLPEGVKVVASDPSLSVVVSGSGADVDAISRLIQDLDIPAMSHTLFRMIPLLHAEPSLVSALLTEYFRGVGTVQSTSLRAVPLSRPRAVVLMGATPELMARASDVVRTMDQVTGDDTALYVWPLRSVQADQVVSILSGLLGTGGGARRSSPPLAGFSQQQDMTGISSVLAKANSAVPSAAGGPAQDVMAAGLGAGGSGQSVILADPVTNSIIARLRPADWSICQEALLKLDRPPVKVLLEASVIEVTLTDQLRYGVQHFLETSSLNATFARTSDWVKTAAFPGAGLILKAGDYRAVVDVLDAVTDVRVLTSPRSVVDAGKPVNLSVGGQVPVLSQTSQPLADGSRVVKNVSYRDTGVVFRVVPSVDALGQITARLQLTIAQAVKNLFADIDSPAFQNRSYDSVLTLGSGQTVVLGGLRRASDEARKIGVPGLSDVPFIGALFGTSDVVHEETELVLVLTATTITDSIQQAVITEDSLQSVKRAFEAWGRRA